jgi:choline dehydrogenase-like flavoprotein
MQHYDIIIIGTGSGGSTMALKLAASGKRILLLERGGFIPKEKQNWDAHEVVTKGRYRPNDTWYDQDDNPFKPFIHYNVGGNSKMYGAAMFRFRESDFKKTKHYGGISPAWPLQYEALEPYYSQAESLYNVHGQRGADPTEPWTSGPYPLPPLQYEPLIEELNEGLGKIGLRPFPLPMGIKLPQDFSNLESPVMLENFDGFPDPTDSKADGYVTALKPVLKNAHVTLLTNAYVDKLDTDETGRLITKVHAEVDGKKIVFSAGMVIVACGAVNSAALMLRSANKQHPDGLANSSGLVGRNLMLHHNGCLVAFLKDAVNDCVFQKSLGIADFYHGAADSELPLGEIQLMGRNDPDTILWLAEKIYPGMPYEELRMRTLDFWLTSEDLPSPENRVTLTNDGKIKVHYHRNNYAAYEKLKEKLKAVFTAVGEIDERFSNIQWAGYDLDISGMSHQNGTMRFGSNPKESVLDLNCKAHDVDNLYVADASFFPSCGAFNPSLTIVANALRISDHILQHVLATPQEKMLEVIENL